MSKTIIVGKWIVQDGKVIGDDNYEEIKRMKESELIKIADRDGGWTILYRNKNKNNYWELTYPQGEMHGGGPPSLELLNEVEIKERYGNILEK